MRTLEDTIATLRRNLLEATMTRPGTMRITPSLYLSPNGMIAKRFQGQYNLEVISNQIVGGSGAVPTGNDDMDYVKDGSIDILDASFLAANLYPPQGVGMLWVDRDYSLSTEPRPGSSPIPQSYLFGITSNAPNAYMTHSTLARLGSLSGGGPSFVQTHSAKTTALTQADVGVKGAVWQKGVTLSQITSDKNDYEIGQNATTVFRISSDAARNITGIAAPTFDSTASNVPSAWWCILYNVGSFNITLKDNSGSSSAGNKFALDADIVIKPDQGVFLMYDSASTVWRALAYPSSSGGGFMPMPPLVGTDSWHCLGTQIAASALPAPVSIAWPSANRAIYIPMLITEDITVTKLWVYNGATASGNIDVGLYTSAFAKVISAGSTAQAGTSVIQEFNVADTAVTAGMYYLAVAMDNTTGKVFRYVPGNQVLQQAWGCANEASAFPLPSTMTPADVVTPFLPVAGIATRTQVA